MRLIRIILTKTNEVKVQRRPDNKYDDTTLPAGVQASDVKEQVVVNPLTLFWGANEPKEWPPTSLTKRNIVEILHHRSQDAALKLGELDDDTTIPPTVKPYIQALRDVLEAAELLRTD